VKEKFKKLEFQLRKMLKLNDQSQIRNDQSKSNIGNIIRRRKGEPDKWISCKLNGDGA
jgi:hypothetical protein